MFIIRNLNFGNIQNIIDQFLSHFRIHPEKYIFVFCLGFIAHYCGFIAALTHFEPFYVDWRFFFSLSIAFLFVLLIGALIVQGLISLMAFLSMLFSYFAPDKTMKANKIYRFQIPILRIQVINYTVLGSVFILLLLIFYTDLAWYWIIASLLISPFFIALWAFISYHNIKTHKLEPPDFDIGKHFELTAAHVDQSIETLILAERNLEAYLTAHIPEYLRFYIEKMLAEIHQFNARMAAHIPEKEEVAAEISYFQEQLRILRWDLAYARFALPKLRSMIIGVFLIFSFILGYGHKNQFVSEHQMELTLHSGESFLATPLARRGSWQILYKDKNVIFENEANLVSMTPAPIRKEPGN